VLSAANLKAIARARLADAEALLSAGRFDGSAYLCGYVVELALKARLCRTLKWPGFPENHNEFQGLQTFKTDDLDILLRLSGREQYIKVNMFSDWTVVSQWTWPIGTDSFRGEGALQSLRSLSSRGRTRRLGSGGSGQVD